MIDIDALKRDKRPQSAWVVHALIDRLEAAEEERDALRARIEAMEQQEPICITTRAHLDAMENGAVRSIVGRDPVFATRGPNDIPLYALPGAKGE